METQNPSLKTVIKTRQKTLTKKGKILAEFVLSHPEKAVFMTTRELASSVGASEATVVRFVRNLGYESYALFIRHLRDHIDTGMTLPERQRLAPDAGIEGDTPLNRTVIQEIENLKALVTSVDPEEAKRIITLLDTADELYIIGSRLSYATAFYMGWTLGKIRGRVHILKGSDSTCIDRLTTAGGKAAAVIVATSRYPNELLRIGRYIKRLGIPLVLITDGTSCPLLSFSDCRLIAPYRNIPFLGSLTALTCLINYLVHALAKTRGEALEIHQEKLEQAYLENDLLFNLETRMDR